MPVLLSLQTLGVARTDSTISRNTQRCMRAWRLLVWITLVAYVVVVAYSYLVQGADSFLVRHKSRLELVDAALLFSAGVIANVCHNFQPASLLEIVHSLNELATKSELQKQGEIEELRCFFLSLLNWLCHAGGAIIYIICKSDDNDIFEQTELLIRMLLISTTVWVQVISASELCWSIAHFMREVNILLMRRVSLRPLFDMRIHYSKMVTNVRDVNRLYSVSIGIAYIHAVTRTTLTVQLFLSQYEYQLSATLWMWAVYEIVMLGCLVTISEASNSLRTNGVATAVLVGERISEFGDAPQQLTLFIRSLKQNTLQLNLVGLIPLSRTFFIIYFGVLIGSGVIYVMQNKSILSTVADTTSV